MRCVLTPSQARNFVTLKRRTLLPTKFTHKITLRFTGLFDGVFTILRKGGLRGFVDKSVYAHSRLTLEFLSTLKLHSSSRGYEYYCITFNAFNFIQYDVSTNYWIIWMGVFWGRISNPLKRGNSLLLSLKWLGGLHYARMQIRLVKYVILCSIMFIDYLPWPYLVNESLPKLRRLS